jgi:hypothetical protein
MPGSVASGTSYIIAVIFFSNIRDLIIFYVQNLLLIFNSLLNCTHIHF